MKLVLVFESKGPRQEKKDRLSVLVDCLALQQMLKLVRKRLDNALAADYRSNQSFLQASIRGNTFLVGGAQRAYNRGGGSRMIEHTFLKQK